MGLKQFHLMCTSIIWCLFSFWSECSKKSLGTVVILPLIHIGYLQLTISSLKQLILDQPRQMGIKQFHLLCTFIIWCLFSFWSECSKKSLGTVVILPLIGTSTRGVSYSFSVTVLMRNWHIWCVKQLLPYSGLFSWVENSVKSWKRPPELIRGPWCDRIADDGGELWTQNSVSKQTKKNLQYTKDRITGLKSSVRVTGNVHIAWITPFYPQDMAFRS